ncbi:MAG TPA: hypothetical protein VGX23_05330 [Actinocrinis sp.]|nr:hypothetical protein [Actinocrinis sp.]
MSTTRRPSRKRVLGFRVGIERHYDITQVVGYAVYLATAADTLDPEDVGRIFNPSFGGYRASHDAQQYADFRVAGYIGDGRVYGTRHEFHPTTGVELAQIESMARVLRRIDKAQREQGGAYVDSADFPRHLFTVAAAIGAQFYAYRPHERGPLTRTDTEGITRVLAELLPARPTE